MFKKSLFVSMLLLLIVTPVLASGTTSTGDLTWRSSHNDYYVSMDNCQKGNYCYETINISNYGSSPASVDVNVSWGNYTQIINNSCSQPIPGGQACSFTVRGFLPNGYSRYYDGAISITGLRTPRSGRFYVCLAEASSGYCD